MKKFPQKFYSVVQYKLDLYDRPSDPNGFLFADGRYRTRILPSDLPQWYIRVYIYREYNYLSAMGVKHLVYKPNYFTEHRFKDDALYISFGSEITRSSNRGLGFEGYDFVLFGPSIPAYVQAVRQHSGLDTSIIEEKIVAKERWFQENYPPNLC